MIVLSGGEYTGTNNCGLAIRKSVKLVPAEGDIVTIDCEGSSFHFHVESGSTLMIENLNITRGAGLKGNAFQGRGGCIVVEGSGGVSITNSKLSHCSAVWGGAVALIGKDSSLVLASSVVESCTASAGGGAVALQGISRLMLEDSVLEGNVADGQGGAIHLSGSSECAIQGGRLEGNQARRGGALFVSDGSASTVKGTLLTGNMACATPGSCRSAPCAAADLSGEEGLGGGIGTERSAVVTLEGVQLVGNEARGSGGCVHHAGLELRLMGEVVMRECKACNSGGAMEALGLVSVESGGEAVLERNSVDNPLSGEGYGGAASLVGSGASLRVSEGALLTVRFNTARSDGGGVHMTDGGTLNVQAQACSADCSPKGSTCDLSCFSSACGWDKGNCNSLFEDVSTAPCVRDAGQDNACMLPTAGRASGCGSSCLTPSCDWGQQPNSTGACSAQGSEIRGCPLFDAMAYGSLLAQSGGSSSGFKPRLPGAGLDYSPEELLSLKDKPLGDVLKQYPGCGSVALNFVGNEALGGNGGGIFQESCDAGLTGRGICFVGISSSAGSVLANFESNRAAGSGGAFYTGCDEIGEPCEALLNDALDFGKWSAEKIRLVGNEAAGYGNDMATFPAEVAILSAKTTYLPGQDPVDVVLQLKDGRGQVVKALDLSANPYLVETFACPEGIECSVTNSWVPAAFHPLAREDGNLLTVDTPQLLRCPVSRDKAGLSVVLHVRLFGAEHERLHQEIEVSCLPCEDGTSLREQDSVWWCETCPHDSYILNFNEARESCPECPLGLVCEGTSNVTVRTAGAQWEAVNGMMSLLSCPQGMYVSNPADSLQECVVCPSGSQCLDASCTECSPCPAGSYKADAGTPGCERCPKNTFLTYEGATQMQECTPCPTGTTTNDLDGQSLATSCNCPAHTLRSTSSSGEVECARCPSGARCQDAEQSCALDRNDQECDGVPIVGKWVRSDDVGRFTLTGCPDKHSLINTAIEQPAVDPFSNSSSSLFSYDSQRCMPCDVRFEYIQDPKTQLCKTCPAGLECSGGKDFLSRVQGSTWEFDKDGVLKLLSCPTGYRQVSGEGVADADQECQPCPAGSECRSEPCLECTSCLPGSFKPQSGFQLCTACPQGTYNGNLGSISSSECMECPPSSVTNGTAKTKPDDCACSEETYPILDSNGALSGCATCPLGARCPDQSCALVNEACEIAGSWERQLAGEFKLLGCPEGYSRINTLAESFVSDFSSPEFSRVAQRCKRCQVSEYVFDPNAHSCQLCPSGLDCNGGSKYSKKEPVDAVWEVEGQAVVLKSCPAGYERVSEPASLQRCKPCDEGKECISPPCENCTLCAPGTFKAFGTPVPCQKCPVGTYNPDPGQVSITGCEVCPGGKTTDQEGSTSLDACKCAGCRKPEQAWCAEAFYYVPRESTSDEVCEMCPVGAECDGSSLRTRDNLQGAVWKAEGTKYWLQSCPSGHQLVRKSHEQQECLKCAAGSYILRSDDPTLSCQPCPASAVCPNGGPPIFSANQITITFTLDGIATGDIDPLAEQLISEALAESLSVDPSVIVLSFQSLARRGLRRSYLRQAAGVTITGDVFASEGDTSSSIDKKMTSSDFSSVLSAAVSAKIPGVSASVLTVANKVAVSEEHRGWIVEQDVFGNYRLVGCPNGSLIVNDDPKNEVCSECQENSYTMSAFDGCAGPSVCGERTCNPCAKGLICTGGAPTKRLSDSVWSFEELIDGNKTWTLLRVQQCPQGHVVIRSSEANVQAAANDDCASCSAGHYSFETARYAETSAGLLVSERASELVRGFDMCLPCPGERAECLVTRGSDGTSVQVVKPSSGYWRGTQMICPEEACSSWSGVCEAARCFPLHDERRAKCEGNCRVTAMIYRCPPGACPQIGQSSDVEFMNTCAEGHEGPVCGQCSEGYALEAGACRSCLDNGARFEVATAFVVLFLVMWLYFFSFQPLMRGWCTPLNGVFESLQALFFGCMASVIEMLSPVAKGKMRKGSSDNSKKILHYQSFIAGYAKIGISFVQVTGSFLAVFWIEWPFEVVGLWSTLSSLVQMDLFSFPGMACITPDVTFREKLMFSTMLLPGIFLGLCLAPFIAYVRRNRGEENLATFKEAVNLFFFSILFFIFITYPAISRTILDTFATSNLGTDGCWLRSDYTFACPGSGDLEWIWSVIFTALIIVGVPVFMLGALLLHGVPKMAKAKTSESLLRGLLNSYRESIKSKFVQNISEKGRDGAALARVQLLVVEALKALREDGAGPGAVSEVHEASKRRVIMEALQVLGVGYMIDESQLHRLLLASFPLFEVDRCMDGEDCLEQFVGAVVIVKSLHDLDAPDLERLSRNQITLLLFHCYLCELKVAATGEPGEIEVRGKMEGGMGSASGRPNVTKSEADANSKMWSRFDVAIMNNQSMERSVLQDRNVQDEADHAEFVEDETLKSLRAVLRKLEDKPISTKDLGAKLVKKAVELEAQGLIAVTPPKWDGSFDGESEVIDRIGFLFQTYRPEVWWFEIFLTLEKLLMCAILIVVWPGSASQVFAGFFVNFLTLASVAFLRPYADPALGFMQLFALGIQAFTLLIGLLLITKQFASTLDPTNADQRRVMGIVLVFLYVLTFFAPFVKLLLESSVGFGNRVFSPAAGRLPRSLGGDPTDIKDGEDAPPLTELGAPPVDEFFIATDIVAHEGGEKPKTTASAGLIEVSTPVIMRMPQVIYPVNGKYESERSTLCTWAPKVKKGDSGKMLYLNSESWREEGSPRKGSPRKESPAKETPTKDSPKKESPNKAEPGDTTLASLGSPYPAQDANTAGWRELPSAELSCRTPSGDSGSRSRVYLDSPDLPAGEHRSNLRRFSETPFAHVAVSPSALTSLAAATSLRANSACEAQSGAVPPASGSDGSNPTA